MARQEYKVSAGRYLRRVCEDAARFAVENGPCFFEFNGPRIDVNPGDTKEMLEKTWTVAYENYWGAKQQDVPKGANDMDTEEPLFVGFGSLNKEGYLFVNMKSVLSFAYTKEDILQIHYLNGKIGEIEAPYLLDVSGLVDVLPLESVVKSCEEETEE